MGRISTGVGLISGINTDDIISKLIALDSRPRDLAQQRIENGTTKKAALLGLSAKLLTLQSSAKAVASNSLYNARSAVSSNNSILTATAGAGAVLGSTALVAVRQAQAQRLASNGYADADATQLAAGTITIKQGGFVHRSTPLEALNGGAGVPLGTIQITNRAGAQTTVSLTAVKTIDDVLDAINGAPGVGVSASVDGDKLVLTDTTGQSTTSISVRDLNGGATVVALGLATGSTYAGDVLTGADVVRLGDSLQLSSLNDGNGIRRNASGNDIRFTLKDGSTIDVGLSGANTIQDVVNAINNDSQNTGDLVASVSANGESLKLSDTSVGGGTLTVSALAGSKAAQDLGILGDEQGGGVLNGRRLLAGFNSVLLTSLNGGSGVGALGTIGLTDRSGASATIDLSAAASLSDVVSAINAAGVGLHAALNSAGNGLKITDQTGASTTNLKIADVSGAAAAGLHIAIDTAANSVDSGDLNLRYIGENTRLDRLNGGNGVQLGKISVTDSKGRTRTVDLSGSNIKTIGDVIQTLNSSGASILASVNSTGDGILVTDTAGGGGQLKIEENGGNTAANLKLLGSGNGQIDGAFRDTIEVTNTDTLSSLFNKFAALTSAPINASLTNDGSSVSPWRLLVGSTRSGEAGRLLIDGGTTGLNFSTLSEGQDALLQVGAGSSPLLFASANNTFKQVLTGVNVQIFSTSNQAVNVTVSQNTQGVSDAVSSIVQNFNGIVDTINSLTSYDTITGEKGTLFNDATTLQVQSAIYQLISASYGSPGGSIQRLADLGVTMADGKLQFDPAKMNDRLAGNPSGVQDFLNALNSGFGGKLESRLKNITDAFDGIIAKRVQNLDDDSEQYQRRVELLNSQLDARRLRLQRQFNAMEQALAAVQSQQSSLTALANLANSINTTTSSRR